MAVSGKPNAEYMLDSLMANLKLITTANGFWVDVKTVLLPEFEPFADIMMAVDDPALLVWVVSESPEAGRIGAPDRAMEVWIAGVIKSERLIQVQLIRLMTAVRQCLLNNRQLNYPGLVSVPNTWGRRIEEMNEGVVYEIKRGDQSKASGRFLSKWKVVYGYTSQAG